MSEKLGKGGKTQIDHFLQERADLVGLTPNLGESVKSYRSRVASELRAKGYIIEAHEAQSGRLYDDPDQGLTGPMTGILGAVAQSMEGVSYSTDPQEQVADDITAGVVKQHGKSKGDSALGTIISLLGPKGGIDLISGLSQPKGPKSPPTPKK